MTYRAWTHALRFLGTLVVFSAATATSLPMLGQANQEQWNVPERAQKKQNLLAADKMTITAGKKLYERECLSCHGKTGRGDGSAAKDLEVPPGDLTDATRMKAQTDGELFWKITEGRTPMPTFKKALSEEERWQLVHYLRTLVKEEK